MLGNYSFVIKALDPQDNTVKEGFKFSKPITIAMFYDVDNLVKANSKHVNNEVTKEDIDPVLYLWDSKNDSWWVNRWKDFKNETLKKEKIYERTIAFREEVFVYKAFANAFRFCVTRYWVNDGFID